MATQGESFFLTEASCPSSPLRRSLSPAKSLPNVPLRDPTPAPNSAVSGRGQATPVLSKPTGTVSGLSPPRSRRGLRKFANTVTAMMSMRNMSGRLAKKDRTKPKEQNSFKLDPEDGARFSQAKVETVIEDTLSQQLSELTYDPAAVKELVPRLSNVIKAKVKALHFDRHRIICNVTVGQNVGQGVEFASRCLWDDSRDSWACATFSNESIFAIATVHGVYYE